MATEFSLVLVDVNRVAHAASFEYSILFFLINYVYNLYINASGMSLLSVVSLSYLKDLELYFVYYICDL